MDNHEISNTSKSNKNKSKKIFYKENCEKNVLPFS